MKAFRFALAALLAVAAALVTGSLGIPVLSRVDWVLLAVAYQATFGDYVSTTLFGCGAGLVQDILFLPLRGANGFAKALLGFLLTLFSVRLVFGGAAVTAAVLFFAKLANDFLVAMFGRLLLGTPLRLGWAWPEGAAATAMTGGVLYWSWRFPWRQEWQSRRRRKLR